MNCSLPVLVLVLTPRFKKAQCQGLLVVMAVVVVVVDVKSVQIKANIQTKIASQIAQNTNRPRGLQVTLIVMKVCQARLSQDIDETDMK